MRAHEFITEGGTGSLTTAVARAMPTTWELPGLPNQDPYLQYRMGVEMANARSNEHMNTQSAFGENMTVVGYTDADNETVQLALKNMGAKYGKGARSIATRKSEEALDVYKTSPVVNPGPIKRRS